MRRKGLFHLIAGAACCLGFVFGGVATAAPSGQVVIAQGQPVQIAVAVDDSGLFSESGPSVRNAVQAAIERDPTVRGFPIQISGVDATCGGGSASALAQNATVANSVVANAQNVAVIGHACSLEAPAWLPVYETAGLVTINGSTTGTFVPPLGPSVSRRVRLPHPGRSRGCAIRRPALGWPRARRSHPDWRSRGRSRTRSPRSRSHSERELPGR